MASGLSPAATTSDCAFGNTSGKLLREFGGLKSDVTALAISPMIAIWPSAMASAACSFCVPTPAKSLGIAIAFGFHHRAYFLPTANGC